MKRLSTYRLQFSTKIYVQSALSNFRNRGDFALYNLVVVWLGVCQFRTQLEVWDAVYLYGFSWRKIMLMKFSAINFIFGANFAFIVKLEDLLSVLVSTLVFVSLGLIVFGLAFFFINAVTPFSIKKEIEEDHNVAVSVVIGSIIIGIAIIIAAAISG